MSHLTAGAALKLTLPRADLVKALDFVARAVERKTTIPILAHVKLAADGDGFLQIDGTNLDMTASALIDVKAEATGALTVDGHRLHEIVRKLDDKAMVALSAEDNGARLSVKAGRARFQINALSVADFPELATPDLRHRFNLPCETLARALQKTAFAISNEETRYYLNGVYMHQVDDRLRFVSTDGHRLARFETAAPQRVRAGADDPMPGVIIPRKCCAELAKLVKGAAGIVNVSLSDSKISFDIDKMSITSKLIDGSFPDYERVIPKDNAVAVGLDRADLAPAVERVATVATERGRGIKLSFSPGALQMSAQSADIGSASEELEADYSGAPLDIGFNAAYLAEILTIVEGGRVELHLRDSGSPAILRDPADEDLLIVLMPMRVG